VDAAIGQRGRACDVVAVVRVAAIDHDVVALEVCREIGHHRAGHCGGHHDPHGARRIEAGDQLFDRRDTKRTLTVQLGNGACVVVVDNTFVAMAHDPAHDVRAHPAEADHAELHQGVLPRIAR
jgi:hypothetical protein